LGFELSDDVIHKITTCKQWAAEQFLLMLREKVTLYDSIPDQQMSPPNSSIGERSEYGLFCSFHHNLFPSLLCSGFLLYDEGVGNFSLIQV